MRAREGERGGERGRERGGERERERRFWQGDGFGTVVGEPLRVAAVSQEASAAAPAHEGLATLDSDTCQR